MAEERTDQIAEEATTQTIANSHSDTNAMIEHAELARRVAQSQREAAQHQRHVSEQQRAIAAELRQALRAADEPAEQPALPSRGNENAVDIILP